MSYSSEERRLLREAYTSSWSWRSNRNHDVRSTPVATVEGREATRVLPRRHRKTKPKRDQTTKDKTVAKKTKTLETPESGISCRRPLREASAYTNSCSQRNNWIHNTRSTPAATVAGREARRNVAAETLESENTKILNHEVRCKTL